MALVIADRVRETTTTTGTGTLTLAGPYTGFQAFSVIGNGNTTYYAIVDAQNGAWEVGIGTYTSSGNTLSRTTVLASSNAGSLVNFAAGTKDVILTQPSERAVLVPEGGTGLYTGVAAFTANGIPYANSTTTLATGSSLTFDGTTLAAPNISSAGSWTFSGGTANGVAYLNGSKVLTTGSALTFDGTNLGIGVTPSAWSGYGGVIELKGIGFVGSATTNMQLGANFYYNGTNSIYKTTAAASLYQQNSGQHQWYNAASGTAGAQITFTQAMTLSASGSLGLGITSPTNWGSYQGLEINGTSGGILSLLVNTTERGRLQTFSTEFDISAVGAIPMVFNTNGTERARIDSSGNFGIGTSSPDPFSWGTSIGINNASYSALSLKVGDVGKAYVAAGSGAMYIGGPVPVLFYTGSSGNGTERARIDSSGNLLVGTTSGWGHTLYKNIQSDWAASTVNANSTAPWGHFIYFSAASPNNSGEPFLHCYDNSNTTRMRVTSNGGIANYQANDVNLSDRREKTNFAPAGDYLSKICAIPVQTFNYIDQNMEEDTGLTLGVVAQDVRAVAPELVLESNWGTEDEPKMRLSVYQTDLQYALMKCIQEQQAIIETLTARVAALESK